MNQLKCTTVNCQHNLKCHCGAGVIAISDNANCQTRMKRAGGALEQTFAEMEASEESIPDCPTVVKCDAECVYNKDGECSSASIFITDGIMNTKCKTRIKP